MYEHFNLNTPTLMEMRLVIDEIVGENTWFALSVYSDAISVDSDLLAVTPIDEGEAIDIISKLPENLSGVSDLARETLSKAIIEIGVREEPSGSNRGTRVDLFQTGPFNNPDLGIPWCACFVSWCVYQAVNMNLSQMPFSYTGSSRAIERSLSDRGVFVRIENADDLSEMMPGDILVWYRCGLLDSKYGHIGFVHHFDQNSNSLFTIEGNRSNKVWSGRYSLNYDEPERLIRGLVGFGRL